MVSLYIKGGLIFAFSTHLSLVTQEKQRELFLIIIHLISKNASTCIDSSNMVNFKKWRISKKNDEFGNIYG